MDQNILFHFAITTNAMILNKIMNRARDPLQMGAGVTRHQINMDGLNKDTNKDI